MSYDLYFLAGEGKLRPDASALANYFRGRAHYEVTSTQALYDNENTGVYFGFDIDDVSSAEEPDFLASFNINYLRPHIFGLEAEPEVRHFIHHFGLSVSDPQNEGMGEGAYSTEGFLRGWNVGNEFGYKSILSHYPENPVMTLAGHRIEECWRWNYERERLQLQLSENVFVPRFMFVEQDGVVKSVVVWPDAIPVAIPKADLVFIPRKDILPRRFFRQQEDTIIVEWDEIEKIIGVFPIQQGALPYRLVNYQEPPADLINALRNLVTIEGKIEIIPVDSILDAELVEKVQHHLADSD